jgi:exopolyphosphatase/guanosine-5'-triphosphate,3'-diphosphate pyrophosphatase
MRVAVVDIGTNSTRLLVADVEEGRVSEIERESVVTRLGENVDRDGVLADGAIARVFTVLDDYSRRIERCDCDATIAVLTSAVRDADNGERFTAQVRERYGLDARVIAGEEEARLTFLGATALRDPGERSPLLVVDIGGGSTELVVGRGGEMEFHVSTQAGVVRQTERHLHDDPPPGDQIARLREEVRGVIAAAVPAHVRDQVEAAIAVAGTATSAASIDRGLEPYDPTKVEGHVLSRATTEALLERLAALPLERRREVPGLHPDRAPTIVAGVAILIEVLDAFGLDRFEVSERDILWGAAIERARGEQMHL